MAELKICSQCGAELPLDAPGGHCPKYLLNLAIGPTGESDIAEPVATTKAAPAPEAA